MPPLGSVACAYADDSTPMERSAAACASHRLIPRNIGGIHEPVPPRSKSAEERVARRRWRKCPAPRGAAYPSTTAAAAWPGGRTAGCRTRARIRCRREFAGPWPSPSGRSGNRIDLPSVPVWPRHDHRSGSRLPSVSMCGPDPGRIGWTTRQVGFDQGVSLNRLSTGPSVPQDTRVIDAVAR